VKLSKVTGFGLPLSAIEISGPCGSRYEVDHLLGMLHCVVSKLNDISVVFIASINDGPHLRYQLAFMRLHSATSQKMIVFILANARTKNLTGRQVFDSKKE
jgi:hypothetical protein